MHYYTFHPKDYISKTHFLEPMEDLAYRRMLDYIYLNECHLPADIGEIAKKINMRTHSDSIANVLQEFFDLTEYGYMNDRAEKEIAKYQEKSDKARQSAAARWNKKPTKASKGKASSERNANALPTQCDSNANQEPLTINQEPLTNDSDSEKTKQTKVKKVVSSKMEKPTLADAVEYFAEKGSSNPSADAENWFDYYTSNGWKVGKNPMKNWKATVSRWIKNNYSQPTTNQKGLSYEQPKQSDYEIYRQDLERQFAAKNGQATEPTINNGSCGNVYDMEKDLPL